MFVATVIVSLLLAALLCVSATLKLRRQPAIVESMQTVGVTGPTLNYLAYVLYLGAVGLVIGLFLAPIGVLAALCLVIYFVLAVGAHVRAQDTAHMLTPALLAVLSLVALVLRIGS